MLNLTGVIFASVGLRSASVELPLSFRYDGKTKEFAFRAACYVRNRTVCILKDKAPAPAPLYNVFLLNVRERALTCVNVR